MKLYSFSPSKLSYLDCGEFIVRYIADITNQNIDTSVDLDFKELHDALVLQSPVFNLALSQIRAKAESQDLLVLDGIRDKKISTLRTAFAVAKNSDVATEKEAYAKIKIIMNAYKGIETFNYPTESLAIANLLSELRNETNLPFIQTLGLAIHCTNLETANANFIAKFDARSTDSITSQTYDTKLLKKNILATYKELTDYVVVISKRRNNDYYDNLIKTINYSRQYFAPIVAGYKTNANPPAANS